MRTNCGAGAQIVDVGRAGIAHRRLDAADELVNDILGGALVGHLTFDPFGHQLERILDILLEIAIRAAPRHGAHRAHAAIALVGAALVEKGLARRLLGACQHRADHDHRCARCQRLGRIARSAQAAVGDHRHAGFLGLFRRIHDRGQLGNADAGDDARGADRARADADLDRVRPGIDQRPRRLAGRDIARDDLRPIGQLLDPLDRAGNLAVVAVGGVDDDDIAFRREQRLGALETHVADGSSGGNAQPPGSVLGRGRIGHCLFDILDRDQADAAELVIDHQQLFNPTLVKQAARFILADPERHGRQILMRHQLAHRLFRVGGKAHIAVGQDSGQPAALLDHGNAADAIGGHQCLRLAERCIGGDGDRIDHHAALETLDRTHCGALFFHRQIAVQHANAAELRHDNRHVGLGHRVHRRGDHRDIERDGLLVRRVLVSAALGRMSDSAGRSSTSSKVRPRGMSIFATVTPISGRFVAAHVNAPAGGHKARANRLYLTGKRTFFASPNQRASAT